MKAVQSFLVKIDHLYKDGIITNSGVKIYTPIDYANVDLICIDGEVIGVPKKYQSVVNIGDRLIFDHNILRNIYSYNGDEVYRTPNYILHNICVIPTDDYSLYGYIRDGEIYGLNNSVFVEPIRAKDFEQVGNLLVKKDTYKGYELNTGIIASHEKKGKKVLYSDYSEHKFIIDGKIYWRMRWCDIIAYL